VCEACHIRFIGPDPSVIKLLGDKARAKKAMRKAGVPMLPGSDGPVTDEEHALKVVKDIGYPVIVKAVAGGGGRGMRVVNKAEDLGRAFQAAQLEAKTTFGNDAVYLERYFLEPRHIEVQIVADHRGHVVHLGERDCSIQRRHQKLVEETPSPAVDEKLRREICRVAVEAVKAVHYRSVGTVEFLLDKDHNFFFMEVNTRIQVEHAITEMVTGIDLIKEQIRIADGQSLSFKQQDVKLNGHSLECRINAEDPETFMPCPGLINHFHAPGGPGVRVDSHIYEGYRVPPNYDSMIGKLIVHGPDRDTAIARMRVALSEMVVDGIKTNIPLQQRILSDAGFQQGGMNIHYLEKRLKEQKEKTISIV
jgi:acetyl-CoA carboxylase biotin carboxylase subunit